MKSKTVKTVALVKSPARDAHYREGSGFSLSEIKEAGKTIEVLKELSIKVDYFRKSKHNSNIELLKALKLPEKKKEKKEAFVKKEKKRTPYRPKIEKIKEKPFIEEKIMPEEPVEKVKPKKKPSKKVVEKEPVKEKLKKEKVKPTEEEEKEEKPTGIPITELSGLGQATAKKFYELGVKTIEDLLEEKPEELAPLIKGVSEDRLINWMEEGKNLLKK